MAGIQKTARMDRSLSSKSDDQESDEPEHGVSEPSSSQAG